MIKVKQLENMCTEGIKRLKSFGGFTDSWRDILYKIPLDILKELAHSVQKFFKSFSYHLIKVAPLHIASLRNDLQLFQYVLTKARDKNPKGQMGVLPNINEEDIEILEISDQAPFLLEISPLHIAAMYGHLEFCKLFLDNSVDGSGFRWMLLTLC